MLPHIRSIPATNPAAVWNVEDSSFPSPVGSFHAAPSYSNVDLAYFRTGLLSLVTIDALLTCVGVGLAFLFITAVTSIAGLMCRRDLDICLDFVSFPVSASLPGPTGPLTSLRLFPGHLC